MYTARQYPPEYWNRTAFVNGPTGHLVGTFVLKADGSDFHSTSPFNLLASDDEWSAPIMSEVGPDGNVWVIDWYNYIVQHNPTPKGFKQGKGNAYETNLRDKKHGRIYRVVYGDAGEPFTLADASPEKLVATLTHPTMLWRKHAQRLLVERGKTDVVDSLIALVREPSVDSIGLNVGAIHALWTLHGLGQLDGSNPEATAAAVAALKHRSAGVRRNAVQVLPPTEESAKTLIASGLLDDPDAQVRLAALLALADLPGTEQAGPAILAEMSGELDRWLADASVAAAATNADSFLAAIARSKTKPTGRMSEAMTIVANHYGRSGPVDTVDTVIAGLTDADPGVAESILNGLATGWPADKQPKLSPQLEENLKQVMQSVPTASKGLLVKLARSWGSDQFEEYAKEVSESLLSQIDDEELDVRQRAEAAAELVKFRSLEADVAAELLDRISPQLPPAVALGIVQAIAGSEAPEIGGMLSERFETLSPSLRTAGIRVLLSRPEWTAAMLRGVEQGDILLSELTLDQRQAISNHPSPRIAKRAKELLERGGALPNADRQAVIAVMMPITKLKGDAEAGKAVFKKVCANCHMHSGEGNKVGPDLTGMAVHPKAELLTHILDPSRDVEGNYRIYTLLTADGTIVNGLLASESKTALEMYDSEGKKLVVLREDVEALEGVPQVTDAGRIRETDHARANDRLAGVPHLAWKVRADRPDQVRHHR